MFAKLVSDDEPARMAALRRLEILDTAPEQPFDEIVAMVRTVLGVPMAAVTLVDDERQWLKARVGLDVSETPRDVSFCTHTIQQRLPMVVSDAHEDERFRENPLVLHEPSIRSYVGVPLCTRDGYNVGALCAMDVKPRVYSEDQLAILANLARLAMNELELRRIAELDQLTGALSRRGFLDKAAQEIARARRYGRASTVAMLDVDHFKRVNDTHGHPAGDQVLRELAGLLTMLKRPTDLLGRLGGEEFALLMPETGADEAWLACERFREGIAGRAVELGSGASLSITASFGIAALSPVFGTAEDWIGAADQPLYEAKRAGRNRCARALQPEAETLRRTA